MFDLRVKQLYYCYYSSYGTESINKLYTYTQDGGVNKGGTGAITPHWPR